MKKAYLAPQTEAIQLLGENAIMAVSNPVGFISTGSAVSDVYGD